MKRLLILVIAVSIFVISCNNEKTVKKENKVERKQKEKSVAEIVSPGFEYKMEEVFAKDGNCEKELADCAHVVINFPVFSNENMMNANRIVKNSIADLLGFGDVENTNQVNLTESAQAMIKDYQDFKNEFPDSPQVWNFQLKSRINYSDSVKVSLIIAAQSYTGGAHGAVNQIYFNFDKNGKLLKIADLVEDVGIFTTIAEQHFRIRERIKEGESYLKAGFEFPNDKFALPANIGLSKNTFILYYNQYEIAPYSSGPTQLFISFEELK